MEVLIWCMIGAVGGKEEAPHGGLEGKEIFKDIEGRAEAPGGTRMLMGWD